MLPLKESKNEGAWSQKQIQEEIYKKIENLSTIIERKKNERN